MSAHKVLLAARGVKFEDVEYPMLASPKYDGNRLIIKCGKLLSRRMKPQKNRQLPIFLKEIVAYSKRHSLVFDGEFYSHDHHFTKIQSMRGHNWKPPKGFNYHVFDMLTKVEWNFTKDEWERSGSNFRLRVNSYHEAIEDYKFPNVVAVRQIPVRFAHQAQDYYEQCLAEGYEGCILRDPAGGYKHGRSTPRDGLMFKFKRFTEKEAQIIGFKQRTRLTEEYKNSDRGRNQDGSKERSGKQEYRELVPHTIGATIVKLKNGRITNLSLKEGVTYANLGISWKNRKSFIGRWLEFEYQPEGTKDRPRSGRITRLRPDLDDLDE